RAVCEQLLARAPKLTTGQLIEQLKKLAIAVDPDWAQRRYEQGVAERKVVGYRNGDGRRICPGTTCHWTGSRRPAGESTLWPKLPNAPATVPGAVLRRYLEIRDRSCIMISCRAPARCADKVVAGRLSTAITVLGPERCPARGVAGRAVRWRGVYGAAGGVAAVGKTLVVAEAAADGVVAATAEQDAVVAQSAEHVVTARAGCGHGQRGVFVGAVCMRIDFRSPVSSSDHKLNSFRMCPVTCPD
ncbi:MAG: hypothetical protein M3257_06885, partial [Actinomycetota bacterium]|nr:hypothetical protein [Actinomycetota bacterium]